MSYFRFVLLLPFLLLAACGMVRSSFNPEIQVAAKPKDNFNSVEYLTQKPSKNALRIGLISVNGNGFANFDDLIKGAKKKAAKLGGDLIVPEDSGVETSIAYSPGYSTYQANASANYGNYFGYGSSNASGYSVGPSISTIHCPWSVFSVWVYTPSQLGIRLDESNNITSFHLNSDAEKAGVKMDDKLIGIDGYDITDQELLKHLMKVLPGDKVKLTLGRGSKRIERTITALSN